MKKREATTRSRNATTNAIVKILTKGQRARYGRRLGSRLILRRCGSMNR